VGHSCQITCEGAVLSLGCRQLSYALYRTGLAANHISSEAGCMNIPFTDVDTSIDFRSTTDTHTHTHTHATVLHFTSSENEAPR